MAGMECNLVVWRILAKPPPNLNRSTFMYEAMADCWASTKLKATKRLELTNRPINMLPNLAH